MLYDLSQYPPVAIVSQKTIAKNLLKVYEKAQKKRDNFLLHEDVHHIPSKRGDSLNSIPVENHPFLDKKNILPRTRDPKTGYFLSDCYCLVPIKTQTSQVTKTFDPEIVADFLNEGNKNNIKNTKSISLSPPKIRKDRKIKKHQRRRSI